MPPERLHDSDAGLDLYAQGYYAIQPNESVKIDLQLQIALPKDSVGLLFVRSGLGTKHGIRPSNCVGVIDEDYRGNLAIVLHNDSKELYKIKPNDRVAQLVVVPKYPLTVKIVDSLEQTQRGEKGFGSSGK